MRKTKICYFCYVILLALGLINQYDKLKKKEKKKNLTLAKNLNGTGHPSLLIMVIRDQAQMV